MKITEVELLQYRWERGTPIRNGMHTYTHSGLNLVPDPHRRRRQRHRLGA